MSELCAGEKFVRFLIEPEAQSVLMNKNWMLPIDETVSTGTPFDEIVKEVSAGTGLKIRNSSVTQPFAREPEEMLLRWRKEVL